MMWAFCFVQGAAMLFMMETLIQSVLYANTDFVLPVVTNVSWNYFQYGD